MGLTTEVVLGLEDGLARTSAVRCDFLTLMFKSELIHFVGTLSPVTILELNRALAYARELPLSVGVSPLSACYSPSIELRGQLLDREPYQGWPTMGADKRGLTR